MLYLILRIHRRNRLAMWRTCGEQDPWARVFAKSTLIYRIGPNPGIFSPFRSLATHLSKRRQSGLYPVIHNNYSAHSVNAQFRPPSSTSSFNIPNQTLSYISLADSRAVQCHGPKPPRCASTRLRQIPVSISIGWINRHPNAQLPNLSVLYLQVARFSRLLFVCPNQYFRSPPLRLPSSCERSSSSYSRLMSASGSRRDRNTTTKNSRLVSQVYASPLQRSCRRVKTAGQLKESAYGAVA